MLCTSEVTLMTENTKPEAFFIAEQTCLDFLNTVCAPAGSTIEWIENGEELVAWMETAQLILPTDGKWFREKFSQRQLDQVASEAKKLRENFRIFIQSHAGKTLSKSALSKLAPINDLLSRDHQYSQVVHDAETGELCLKHSRRFSKPKDLLTVLAVGIAECVTKVDFSRVRNCENPPCTLWFLDVSKNGRRRWCSMAVCGNRAKAALHRARKKAKD